MESNIDFWVYNLQIEEGSNPPPAAQLLWSPKGLPFDT